MVVNFIQLNNLLMEKTCANNFRELYCSDGTDKWMEKNNCTKYASKSNVFLIIIIKGRIENCHLR
jgi:hypothetical protein